MLVPYSTCSCHCMSPLCPLGVVRKLLRLTVWLFVWLCLVPILRQTYILWPHYGGQKLLRSTTGLFVWIGLADDPLGFTLAAPGPDPNEILRHFSNLHLRLGPHATLASVGLTIHIHRGSTEQGDRTPLILFLLERYGNLIVSSLLIGAQNYRTPMSRVKRRYLCVLA